MTGHQNNSISLIQYIEYYIEEEKIDINVDFIKKFIEITNVDKTFCINLDLLVEYKIYSRKDNAKAKLIKSMIKNVDYTVSSAPESSGADCSKKIGGQNEEIIMLTADCFKHMCMISLNSIGRQIRDYYIILEKIVFKYSNYLLLLEKNYSNKLYRVHEQLKLNHNRHKYKKGNCFYVISYNDKLKFGSTCDINDRMGGHRTSCPLAKIELLCYAKEHELIENTMLVKYKKNRLTNENEWFYDIQLKHITESLNKFLEFLKIEYTYETELNKYNDFVDLLNNQINKIDSSNLDNETLISKSIKNLNLLNIKNNITINDKKEKLCLTCNVIKSLSEFYKKSDSDNTEYRSMCIPCTKVRDKESRVKIKNDPLYNYTTCTKCDKSLKKMMFFKNEDGTLWDNCILCYNINKSVPCKQCRWCYKIKTINNFSRDISKYDGHRHQCTSCRVINNRKYRSSDIIKCEYCNKDVRKKSLYEHYKSQFCQNARLKLNEKDIQDTSDQDIKKSNSEEESSNEESKNNKFECDLCGIILKYKNSIRKHQKTKKCKQAALAFNKQKLEQDQKSSKSESEIDLESELELDYDSNSD